MYAKHWQWYLKSESVLNLLSWLGMVQEWFGLTQWS